MLAIVPQQMAEQKAFGLVSIKKSRLAVDPTDHNNSESIQLVKGYGLPLTNTGLKYYEEYSPTPLDDLRNKQLTPAELNYTLFFDCYFNAALKYQYSISISDMDYLHQYGLTLDTNEVFHVFTNKHQRAIAIFNTCKNDTDLAKVDESGANVGLLPLINALKIYQSFIKANKIEFDLVLIPIANNEGSQHFRLLEIAYSENSTPVITFYESKSSVRFNLQYPNSITALIGSESVIQDQILGDQGVFNSYDCGRHTIIKAMQRVRGMTVSIQAPVTNDERARIVLYCLLMQKMDPLVLQRIRAQAAVQSREEDGFEVADLGDVSDDEGPVTRQQGAKDQADEGSDEEESTDEDAKHTAADKQWGDDSLCSYVGAPRESDEMHQSFISAVLPIAAAPEQRSEEAVPPPSLPLADSQSKPQVAAEVAIPFGEPLEHHKDKAQEIEEVEQKKEKAEEKQVQEQALEEESEPVPEQKVVEERQEQAPAQDAVVERQEPEPKIADENQKQEEDDAKNEEKELLRPLLSTSNDHQQSEDKSGKAEVPSVVIKVDGEQKLILQNNEQDEVKGGGEFKRIRQKLLQKKTSTNHFY